MRNRFLLCSLLLAACCTGCWSEPSGLAIKSVNDVSIYQKEGLGQHTRPIFTDIAPASGLQHHHFNGMSGEFNFWEQVGPGGGFIDFDNDGDLDIYLVQGRMAGEKAAIEDAIFPPKTPAPFRDRLLRNDLILVDGKPTTKFVDVTEQTKIDAQGYGLGTTMGDFDGDGWTDIYVTNFGANQLFRNNRDGTFKDVTSKAGVEDLWFSTSAAFLDYDRDGHLDLYVCNYIDANQNNHKNCYARSGLPDYCGPLSFGGEPDRLFHNRGDGTFEDVTAISGIGSVRSAGLGVVCVDINQDDWIDIYVTNDGMSNSCWINQKNGTFEDIALLSGCALNKDGKAEASMGVLAADFDRDGDDDLFISHLTGETNTFYRNDGTGNFADATIEVGMGNPSLVYTGFGIVSLDYDNDGWLEMLVCNGAVKSIESLVRARDPYPLHEKNQLFRNVGDGRFEEVTKIAGDVFAASNVSRGAAAGDVDNDGDIDVLVFNNNGPVQLLRNEIGNQNDWIGLIVKEANGSDALSAKVIADLGDGEKLIRRVSVDGSYCSSSDPRILIGLGQEMNVHNVRVIWSDGKRQTFHDLKRNSYNTIRRESDAL